MMVSGYEGVGEVGMVDFDRFSRCTMVPEHDSGTAVYGTGVYWLYTWYTLRCVCVYPDVIVVYMHFRLGPLYVFHPSKVKI